jgi:mono/diheme cytochrome c family protein
MPSLNTLTLLGGVAAAILTAGPLVHSLAREPDPQDFSEVERGRELATLADCVGCHTRKGGKPYAGGLAVETPFGNLVSTNITPDPETGIGNWSEEEFDNAVRRGIRRDGAPLYPAMPYNYYTKMSREDVKAVRAYLATLEPVHNEVVANQLPFPFSIRWSMHVWDWLFFTPGAFKPDPTKSHEWNRGAYLVNGPAHCGACHTPKNFLGADISTQALQGSEVQSWFAPNITGDKTRGVGSMSIDEIVALLKTGHNAVAAVSGPMADEVVDATTHYSDADLRAIAAYLQTVPGSGEQPATPVAATDPRMQAGEAIYRDVCSACHAIDGNGVPNLFPSLAKAPQVRADDPTSTIRVVLRGARSVATDAEPNGPAMPSFAWQLDDAQIAAVLTYVRNSWGGAAPAVTADDVANQRDGLKDRTD